MIALNAEVLQRAAEFYETGPDGQYDREAARVLRAMEIMVRRGWLVYKGLGQSWIVGMPAIISEKKMSEYLVSDKDPFTALIAAEEWYKENMEHGTEAGRCVKLF